MAKWLTKAQKYNDPIKKFLKYNIKNNPAWDKHTTPYRKLFNEKQNKIATNNKP